MSRLDNLERLLTLVGAKETKHTGRTLYDHLMGTMAMLEAVEASPATCAAGALHSIYGTNAFRHKSIPSHLRHVVRKCVGERAERLAWTFCNIDRPRALEFPIASDRPGYVYLTERRDGEVGSVEVDFIDLMALRLIEAANLLEQGGDLKRWPVIKHVWEIHKSRTREPDA